MKAFVILFIISFVGWLICFLVYKQMEPDDKYSPVFRVWHLILIFISIFIPVLNLPIFLIAGGLFCIILHDYYHIKNGSSFILKIIKFLNKQL